MKTPERILCQVYGITITGGWKRRCWLWVKLALSLLLTLDLADCAFEIYDELCYPHPSFGPDWQSIRQWAAKACLMPPLLAGVWLLLPSWRGGDTQEDYRPADCVETKHT